MRLAGSLALAIAGVTGCGIVAGKPTRQVPTVALCRAVPYLTQFIVIRKTTKASVMREFSFPSVTHVRNARATQTVASALCRLPVRQPHTLYHCPAEGPDIIYGLRFYRGRHPLPWLTLPTGGCGNVTGLGELPRLATVHLWGVLGHALDLKNGPSAFVGTKIPAS